SDGPRSLSPSRAARSLRWPRSRPCGASRSGAAATRPLPHGMRVNRSAGPRSPRPAGRPRATPRGRGCLGRPSPRRPPTPARRSFSPPGFSASRQPPAARPSVVVRVVRLVPGLRLVVQHGDVLDDLGLLAQRGQPALVQLVLALPFEAVAQRRL